MALAHAPQIITAVQEGTHKATTHERRLCVEFLLATKPGITNQGIADIFAVTERTVRLDKVWIRSQKAKYLKNELNQDLGLVIADIAMDYEKQVTDIERSKTKATPGSKAYLDHCNAVFDMRLKMVKAFQDIGYLPKNLGNMTVDKFEYKAIVNKDGTSMTRPVSMDFGNDKAPEKIEDAEFTEQPSLPPAQIEKDTQETAKPTDHSPYCQMKRRPGSFACTCGFLENVADSEGSSISPAVGSS